MYVLFFLPPVLADVASATADWDIVRPKVVLSEGGWVDRGRMAAHHVQTLHKLQQARA